MYLGAAVFILAAGAVLSVAARIVSLTWAEAFSEPSEGAGSLVFLGGELARSVGLFVVGAALVGRRYVRARRMRLGAWILAGGYVAWFVGTSIVGAIGVLGSDIRIGRLLAESVSFIWVARAFATEDTATSSAAARTCNRRLGRQAFGSLSAPA